MASSVLNPEPDPVGRRNDLPEETPSVEENTAAAYSQSESGRAESPREAETALSNSAEDQQVQIYGDPAGTSEVLPKIGGGGGIPPSSGGGDGGGGDGDSEEDEMARMSFLEHLE